MKKLHLGHLAESFGIRENQPISYSHVMIWVGHEREKMPEQLLIPKRNESKVNEEKNERRKLKRKFKIWLYQNLEMVYNKIEIIIPN